MKTTFSDETIRSQKDGPGPVSTSLLVDDEGTRRSDVELITTNLHRFILSASSQSLRQPSTECWFHCSPILRITLARFGGPMKSVMNSTSPAPPLNVTPTKHQAPRLCVYVDLRRCA